MLNAKHLNEKDNALLCMILVKFCIYFRIQSFLHLILKIKKKIICCFFRCRRALPIDRCTSREKGQPLCMDQYYCLFNTYRIPGETKDYLVQAETNHSPEPEHVIVACKNQVRMSSSSVITL